MNNYQIYDEVGKGRLSTVYKGRRKKTIEYYAISSIDKSRRQRVLTNVRFLRSADHRRMVKFHNWYETNNHLWVITELCVGGDMRQVLNCHSRLSGRAVQMFGTDIAEGLMYIHSRGVVYGDLKPSNILMDSTMTMRFYDFGLSCDFNAVRGEGTVGTPLYMAPELFTKGGVPSMASDLWALGCLLYEFGAGKPPFDGPDLASLITNIMMEPFRRHETLSDELNSLLELLFVKDPRRRASWSDVVAHDFWEGKLQLPATAFPPQPAFESWIQRRAAAGASSQMSMSQDEVKRHVEWAVENAKRNHTIAQFASEGGPTKCPTITEEVDLRDHSAMADAAAEGGGAAPRMDAQADGRRTTAGSTGIVVSATPSQFLCENEGSQSETGGDVATDNRTAATDSSSIAGVSVGVDGLENLHLDKLMMHTSDAHIRPLVMNSRIERFVEQKYDSCTLGFTPPTKAELRTFNEQQQSDFIKMIYRALSSSSLSYEEKLNVLCYFETVCMDAPIANFIVNSSIMVLCLKMVAQRKAPSNYRATAASIMGILVRHATFIHTDLAKVNILSSIIEVYGGEDSPRVRRKLAACLGELLIYIAVQRERDRSVWGLNPAATLNVYLSVLGDADDVLRHYAVKAIENLASVSDPTVALKIFARPEVLTALLAVYALPPASGRSEHMRSSAACAALKLSALREDLIPVVLESSHLKWRLYGEVLADATAPKTAQSLLTFINMAIVKSLVAVRNPIMERWGKEAVSIFSGSRLSREQGAGLIERISSIAGAVVSGLCSGCDYASVAVKGKMLLHIVLLGCMDDKLLLRLSSNKLIGCIDSVVRDKDSYVQRCAGCLTCYLGAFLEAHLAAMAEGSSSGATTATLNVAYNVLTARNLGMMVELRESVFASLGACLERAMSSPRYAACEEELNKIVGLLTQSTERVLKHRRALVNELFPIYVRMLGGSDVERRFSALRTLSAFVAPLADASGLVREEKIVEAEKLDQLTRAVATSLPELLKENEPIPILTLRLLATCGERQSKAFSSIATVELAGDLVRYMLRSKQGNLSVPLQLLLFLVVQTERLAEIMDYLAAQEFFTSVLLKTLTMAVTKDLDPLLEPCCELSAFLLKHAINHTVSPIAQQCLLLLPQQGMESLWLPLCTSPVRSAAENAAACVCHFVHLSPLAQYDLLTTGSLTRLREIVSGTRDNLTVVVFVLRALRYSCERGRKRDVQRVSEWLSPVLRSIACEGDNDRELSAEARALIKLIDA
ncbi:protein kinase [Trypanosoma rangeli SC58]|uniref:Protein kinase n=1 Tax=Trypanosoma rangeli SC58 TaxID=429131 RepID=A0A061J251_TRYRA|nr:protein kinase [Trypanosoma rangeli SC58]